MSQSIAMSGIAPVVEYDAAPLHPRARDRRGALAWIKSHAWALSDQALISLTNFVTLVLTARALDDKSEFGRFSTVYSILLFCNIVQSTLITQAHNVLGTAREGDSYRRYTTST